MAVESPITRTKVVIPRRRGDLVSRPRLIQALDDLLDYKLLIIAAPAGYGKTSLLIDYSSQSNLPICWFSLDSMDQDPLRFITHLIEAIHVRFPAFGRSSRAALKNQQERMNLDVIVTNIVNDLYENVSEHFAVVMDDYHLVAASKPVDTFLNRFLQHVDENCHLVLASRTLLTLPDLPLMVARSQVGGLSFEELVFQRDEVKELLQKKYQRAVSDEEAESLLNQSEGWITGLLLSTQVNYGKTELGGKVARVSGVGLYDYLAQQVLHQQPAEIQEFLLRSSLLDEFDAEFCAEVIGYALHLEEMDWDRLIRFILQGNLFVLPVGEDRVWLRYHHLFQAFLQSRMESDRPGERSQILLRLAEIMTNRHEWERAYSIYQRLDRQDRLADLIEVSGTYLISNGRINLLSGWLDALPATLLSLRPALISLQGTTAVVQGKTEQGLLLLNQAITSMPTEANPTWLLQALLRRSTTHWQMGHYQTALEDVDIVLRLTTGMPAYQVYWAEAMRSRGMVRFYQGKLREALQDVRFALKAYQELSDEEHAARLMMEVGMIEKNLGNDLDAEQAYQRALRYWETNSNSVWQANLLNNLGVLQHLRGDYETAVASLEGSIEHARMAGYPRLEAYALASMAELYRDLDASTAAREATQTAHQIAQRIKDQFLLFSLQLAEGVQARLRGKLSLARQQFNHAREMADQSGSSFQQNLVRLEVGCLKLAEGNAADALHDLTQVAETFRMTGQRTEAGRAHLAAALACILLNNPKDAESHFRQLVSLMPTPARHSPLILLAREFSAILQKPYRGSDEHPMVIEFLHAVEAFEERLPRLRKLLRQRTITVPFGPPRLVITALGKAEVKVNERLVTSSDWKTQSVRDLFFLFLNHPEGLTKEQVGEIFWPDASPNELKLRFKNDIYRLRQAVGKDVVSFFEETYRFNPDLDYEYDVEGFQMALNQANLETSTQEKIAHLRTAIRFFKGDFLPEVSETWVVIERERVHQHYLDALLTLAELYLEDHQYEHALEICRRALRVDPCLESAYRLSMQAYAALGNRAGVARLFEQCQSCLRDELDVPPSQQTQQLYTRLMRA